MRHRTARGWFWTSTALAIVLAATVVLYSTRGWIWLGVTPIGDARVPFSDAAAQLAAADDCANGAGEWEYGVCFLPSVRAETHSQTYEPWLTFQRLGLTASLYVPVAFAMIGVFYLALCLAFRPANGTQAAWLLLFLFSPAVQLAIERANFDLLTSAILCLAARCLADRRPAVAIAGCLALGVDTSLKVYTGLSAILAWIVRRDRRAMIAIAALLSTLAAIAIVGPDSIIALGHGAPEGRTRFSTGAHWLMRERGLAWSIAAAVMASIAFAVAWLVLEHRTPRALFSRYPHRTALLQIAFLTAVPLFLIKDSYDYRFVLWLPCLSLLVAFVCDQSLDRAWRRFALVLLSLCAIVFCAELPCMLLDRLGSGTARLVDGIVLIKQFSVWIVAALLAVLFALSIRDRAKLPA